MRFGGAGCSAFMPGGGSMLCGDSGGLCRLVTSSCPNHLGFWYSRGCLSWVSCDFCRSVGSYLSCEVDVLDLDRLYLDLVPSS